VGIPGLFGILNPLTIAVTTLALAAALFFAPARAPLAPTTATSNRLDRRALLLCTCFALGYAGSAAVQQAFSPVLANDAITYHFPAAVHWLQTGRISLFETWYFNPANTYSPLAGSTFIAWWIAPLGTDVIARHEQFWAVALIYFASLRLARALGARPAVAALVATALVLSQPILRQSISEKDDLYLAAFFACAAAACAPDRLRDSLGPWRLGVALGLLLATKYTALFALPPLLLAIDAPKRSGWRPRHYAIALAAAALVAGPWYLRNTLLAGNPLYPIRIEIAGHTILPGLFSTTRSTQLHGITGLWTVLTQRQQSLPPVPAIALLLACVVAVARTGRQLRTNTLLRSCLLGPPVTLIIFWLSSPFPEARFALPALLLAFAATALAISTLIRPGAAQGAACLLLIVLCAATGIGGLTGIPIADFLTGAAIVTAAGLLIAWLLALFPAHRPRLVAALLLLLLLPAAAWVYVNWGLFLRSAHTYALTDLEYPTPTKSQYKLWYGDAADVWRFIDDKLPANEPLAYANTHFIHPMYGFRHTRPLVYVPTRRGVIHLRDLPPVPGKLSGEQVFPIFAAALTADTDEPGWLERLGASGATHLVVFHQPALPDPPELRIAQAHPDRFTPVFKNQAATVFELHGFAAEPRRP
jgi:hypothetical protein